MEDKNDFIFSQQDLLTCSFSVFHDMQKTGDLSDVTIRIDNRVFSAHRIVLAGAIPFFRTMFTSNLSESKEKVITMKELDPTALESLINFAYTNKVKITTENVQSLLVASDVLQLTKVRDSCCDFISKSFDPSNVMHVRALADSLNCRSLVKNSDHYIRQNFDEICKTKEFLNLSFNFLQELIRRDDLHVKSEEKVFEAVMTWVKSDTNRHNLLPELLTGIRMTLLTPQFLIKKASGEELIMQSLLCRNLLDEAKHYHMLPEDRPPCFSFSLSERCYEEKGGMYLFCCNRSAGVSIMKYKTSTGKWNTVHKDQTRYDVNHVIALHDQIYAFRDSGVFEMFNPRTLKWIRRTNYSSSMSPHRPFNYAVPVGNKIYWLTDRQSAGSAIVFDSEQNKWYNHQQNVHLHGGKLLSFGNVIYVLNTANSDYGSNEIESRIYNTKTRTVNGISRMNQPRINFGAAILDGKIYICGGTTISSRNSIYVGHSSTLSSTEVFNPSDGQWHSLASMNTGRKNFSLTAHNKKLYAIGGQTSNEESIECYDPATNKWTVQGSLSDQYDFVQCVVISDVAKDL